MITKEERERWVKLCTEAWAAPWVAHTFEIDCPCPNGEHCGDNHTCEEVEAPEAYPNSPNDPAAPGEGQCVVQISVPGLESMARPTAEFIAEARSALPRLLAEVERLEAKVQSARSVALEEAAKSCEAEAEACVDTIEDMAAAALCDEEIDESGADLVYAQNVLLDQAGRIRALAALAKETP